MLTKRFTYMDEAKIIGDYSEQRSLVFGVGIFILRIRRQQND
jgi:hypothetical protein